MAIFIDGYEIDVTTSETHEFDSEITADPVEKGSDITDNQRLLPDSVTLTGVVSDTPIGDLANRRVDGEVNSQFALDFLLEVREARQPVTIETSLRTYTNMLMKNLSVPKDAETGDALVFTATFREVRIVTNDRTTIEVALPRAKRKRNIGTKQIEEVPPAEQTVNQCVALLSSIEG